MGSANNEVIMDENDEKKLVALLIIATLAYIMRRIAVFYLGSVEPIFGSDEDLLVVLLAEPVIDLIAVCYLFRRK